MIYRRFGKTELQLPVLSAGFMRAMHSWKDPVERVFLKAKELQIPMITPKIGEPFLINNIEEPENNWWKEVN